MGPDVLPTELRELVGVSVALLGRLVKADQGERVYELIEGVRKQMAGLREGPKEGKKKDDSQTLGEALKRLEAAAPSERLCVARAFTLMLELINTCENAYRSHRLALHAAEENLGPARTPGPKPDAVIYVLTAHPTEARAPENIAAFHRVQRLLVDRLGGRLPRERFERHLYHALQLAWHSSAVRPSKPTVADEAEHLYSTLLEDETLTGLLQASHEVAPFYARSWVGGDKDGHPGVDEKSLKASLGLSRRHLLAYLTKRLASVESTLRLTQELALAREAGVLSRSTRALQAIRAGDGARVAVLRARLNRFARSYESAVGAMHPELLQLRRLMHVFPGLVVPLELRESSDVLMQTSRAPIAIDRMLRTLAAIARGGAPLWYARGFIVSMASSLDHLREADRRARRAFGKALLPVIPLFEQAEALAKAPAILSEWARDPRLGRDLRETWGGVCEVMVGYSDSSKESGVLASRLEIAEAMTRIDRACRKAGVQPLFFQGSGGSVDRGGGTVQDQTAWWPHSALKTYKVTIQGEMVERSLATPEIARGQIERIVESAGASLARPAVAPHVPEVRAFAAVVAREYRRAIADPEFLGMAEKATPYASLGELHIGSRPTRRAGALSVQSLRAIPWVLCWTQTRVLFPTWWGVGTAWREAPPEMRARMKTAFAEEPVYASFVRALGFTLAKVELHVWRIYLARSGLDSAAVDHWAARFEDEFAGAVEFVRGVSGSKDLLWFRPWLGASIALRAPMIHPLNLLQCIALRERDYSLLRLTVTGIAAGMLTTG